MVQCFNNRSSRRSYVHRLEKVKFGVPLSEGGFSPDIPATLLVLLLKINKQGPLKKDIWRAPGNQAQVRKLISIMQHGQLVNIDHFSVYTAASVVKKFLGKIPGGIFGAENEDNLFGILNLDDIEKRMDSFCRIYRSLPVLSQHILVLLFGTFKLISDGAETCGTRMNSEAIGVSVAPTLFHTIIHDNQRAKMEDVVRFRLASTIIAFVVQNFGAPNLFAREGYEFYARITGRTLRLDSRSHFTFQYPARALKRPEVVITPEDEALDYRRLSKSSDVVVSIHVDALGHLDELKRVNKLAESTRSLSYLEWVHERQTRRMQTRSEWYVSQRAKSASANPNLAAESSFTTSATLRPFHQILQFGPAAAPKNNPGDRFYANRNLGGTMPRF